MKDQPKITKHGVEENLEGHEEVQSNSENKVTMDVIVICVAYEYVGNPQPKRVIVFLERAAVPVY